MAKFERLIVYPLLFIALFCSMTGLPVLKAAGGGEGNGDAHNFLRLFQSNPEGGNSNEEKVVVDEVRVKRIIAEEIVVGKPVDGSALEQYVRIGTDESGTMVFENVEGDGRFLIEPSGYTLYNEDMVSASLWYSPWFGTSLRICHNNGEDGITLASGDLYEGSELKIGGNDRHAFLGTKPSKSFLVLTGPENTRSPTWEILVMAKAHSLELVEIIGRLSLGQHKKIAS
ncbi:MAG: hypothetical protein GX030_01365 [Firmicutes bacterium]|nr:hypothetical protein [Bacillota bacterium]